MVKPRDLGKTFHFYYDGKLENQKVRGVEILVLITREKSFKFSKLTVLVKIGISKFKTKNFL